MTKLTDSTRAHLLANGFVAVYDYETRAPAALFGPDHPDRFLCEWAVLDYDEDGPCSAFCSAPAVGLDNGFLCTDGHSHRFDVEYYDEDEAVAHRAAGYMLAPNARLMDGTAPR